jgi:hypothetical protein
VPRYECKRGKEVTIKKANKVCLIRRCPDLFVIRPTMEKGRLKHIKVPVVLESMADPAAACKEGD